MRQDEAHFLELTKFIEQTRDLQEPGSQSYEDWARVLDDVYEYEELVREGFM